MLLEFKVKKILKAVRSVNSEMVTEVDRLNGVIEKLKTETEKDEAIISALRQDVRKAESAAAIAEHDLNKFEAATAEARELFRNVEADRVGVLDTSGMQKRILFEALAERWELLTHTQITQIEEALKNG